MIVAPTGSYQLSGSPSATILSGREETVSMLKFLPEGHLCAKHLLSLARKTTYAVPPAGSASLRAPSAGV